MIYLRRVVGSSMRPALLHGQVVIALRGRKVRSGRVVLARHDGREIIKRVAVVSDQSVDLHGDNRDESTDSRDYGSLPRRAIIGVVVWPRC